MTYIMLLIILVPTVFITAITPYITRRTESFAFRYLRKYTEIPSLHNFGKNMHTERVYLVQVGLRFLC